MCPPLGNTGLALSKLWLHLASDPWWGVLNSVWSCMPHKSHHIFLIQRLSGGWSRKNCEWIVWAFSPSTLFLPIWNLCCHSSWWARIKPDLLWHFNLVFGRLFQWSPYQSKASWLALQHKDNASLLQTMTCCIGKIFSQRSYKALWYTAHVTSKPTKDLPHGIVWGNLSLIDATCTIYHEATNEPLFGCIWFLSTSLVDPEPAHNWCFDYW